MAQDKLDVVGIGNAIVDVISRSDDAFIAAHKLNKGAMQLIDGDQAMEMYAAMGPGIEMSGGSAANTIAGLATLGARCGFIGKVRDDQLGEVFSHDIRSLDIRFDTPMADDGPQTARCLILVTPDAQRTMNTYLGASTGLGPDDIDAALVQSAEIVYLEGYLWDPPAAKDAFLKAMDLCAASGGKVAFTLSDAFCVDRFRNEFRDLVENRIDILFANEAEIKALYQVDDFDSALQALGHQVEIAALTRSEKGSVILRGDEVHVIDPEPVDRIEDTTGAGDLYAAGFLFGLTHGHDLKTCGRLASLCAAEVISHFGARPEADLKALARQKLELA